MNPAENKPDNIYVEELKSLLKDKFFMMLLGISVAIVILSTVYSFVRPKTDTGQIASGEQISAEVTTTPPIGDPTVTPETNDTEIDRDIEGLEPVEEKGTVTGQTNSIFDGLKAKIKGLVSGDTPAVTQAPEVATGSPEVGSNTPQGQGTPKKGETYTVTEGDNLWQIAERAYGSGYNFVDIVASNNLINPDYLEVGQKLTLPSVEAKPSTTGEITDEAASTRSEASVPATYTTTDGDCLWNIAVKTYNNGYEWGKIASLNSLPNPDFIMVGQVLKLK